MSVDSGTTRIAARDTFQYTGGQYLYKNGPQSEDDLFAAMGNTMRTNVREEMIQRGVRAGWFRIVGGGKVDCSEFARAHYDKEAGVVKVEYVGQIAVARDGLGALNRPPLREAYMLNSRGTREDVPAWSQRPAGFGFKNIGGGDA